MLSLKSTEKGKVCYIKANKKFRLHLNGYYLPFSKSERDGKWTEILTAEYCWYKIGKLDRNDLKLQLKQHLDNEIQLTEKEIKKIKDVLKYRSPTLSQMRWLIDLNKANNFLPQPFWNFSDIDVKIEPYDNKNNNIFEYQVGFL